jgi:ubiquinone/menaquinone biosynthesis C-methylase UbiE
MDNNEALKKVYNNWANKYDDDANHNIAIIKIHPIILSFLKEQPNNAIGLDLGCGTGILTIAASKYSKEITGIDYSEEMLKQAKAKKSLGANLIYIRADLSQKLPFPDSSFNYCIAGLFLHHLENIDELYKEISRVLKSGGFFIFDEFVTKPESQAQIDNPFHVNYQDPLSDAKKQGIKVWRIRELEEHEKLLNDAGLKIEKVVNVICDKEIEQFIVGYHYHEGRIMGKVTLARKN